MNDRLQSFAIRFNLKALAASSSVEPQRVQQRRHLLNTCPSHCARFRACRLSFFWTAKIRQECILVEHTMTRARAWPLRNGPLPRIHRPRCRPPRKGQRRMHRPHWLQRLRHGWLSPCQPSSSVGHQQQLPRSTFSAARVLVESDRGVFAGTLVCR